MSIIAERLRKDDPRRPHRRRGLILLEFRVLGVFLLSIVEYRIVLFLKTLGTGL
jgi:hypothetical protein